MTKDGRPSAWVVGAGLGIVVTALALLLLPPLTRSLQEAFRSVDVSALRWAMLWFALFGAAVAGVIVASRRYPMAALVPTVLLGYAYLVVSPTGESPPGNWVPQPIVSRVLDSFGAVPPVIVGILAAAAGWRVVHLYRPSPLGQVESLKAPRPAVGVILGAVFVAASAMVLHRLIEAMARGIPVQDVAGIRRAMLGLAAWGVVLGAVALLGARLPAIAATTLVALLVLVVTQPMVGILDRGLRWPVLGHVGILLTTVLSLGIGLLTATVGWGLLERRTAEPVGSVADR